MKTGTTSYLIGAALCAAVLFGCQGGQSGSTSGAKKEGPVVAEVNGTTITTGEFSRELDNLPDYLKVMAKTPQGRKEMLDTMIIRELLLAQAAKEGVDKSPEFTDKLEDLKKRLIVEAFLKKKVAAEALLSDAELKKFYDQNREKFKAPEQFRASHILVKTEAEAKDILAKLKAGGNFEELARKQSVDASAAQGGDLGWFGKGSMVPVFEKATLALKEGQLSGIVKSDFGFHIIKLTGKRPAGIRPFDEVKEQIKAALMPAKQQEVFQKVKDELKKNAKIAIKEDVLNAMDAKKEEPKPAAATPPAAAPEKK